MRAFTAITVACLLASFSPALGPHDRDLADEGLFNPGNAMLKRGDKADRSVALTFDDGPHPSSAGQILDILKRAHVRATFFVVGSKVVEHPDLVRRMVMDGHEVGNHTMTHPRLDQLNAEQIRKELTGCEQAVERATGRSMTLMRPPGMRFNPLVLQTAKSLGYDTIGWNVGAKDFVSAKGELGANGDMMKRLEPPAQEVAERVVEHVKNGTIILLHDSPTTAAALPEIISELRRQGYRFETVTQMMRDLPDPVALQANPLLGKRSKQALR